MSYNVLIVFSSCNRHWSWSWGYILSVCFSLLIIFYVIRRHRCPVISPSLYCDWCYRTVVTVVCLSLCHGSCIVLKRQKI